MRDTLPNIQRTNEYIEIKQGIDKSKDLTELYQLRNTVLAYHKSQKQDSFELLALYVEREHELTPDPDKL